MTEFELFQALRPFYPKLEYALLPQTGNSTGFGCSRHCDAIALGLWPSRGLHVSGFEIKSYRGDWVREKANPAKAEQIGQFCNYWWIVASGPFVKAEELPEPWGLKVWDQESGKLTVSKKAPFREAKPLDIGMVAAILRKAQEVATPTGAMEEARQAGFDSGVKQEEGRRKRDSEDLAKLRERLRIIEKKSGLKVECWEPAENIGDALNQILKGTSQFQVDALRRVARVIIDEFGVEEKPQPQIVTRKRRRSA